jgi:hypothetical protein
VRPEGAESTRARNAFAPATTEDPSAVEGATSPPPKLELEDPRRNEPDTNPDLAPLLDDDAIARLIEDAGRRPPVERELTPSPRARAAWHYARGANETPSRS